MADLYARIVLRLIGPALALRERGLAERLEGLSEAAQGPCVNAVADELLKSAGFGDPTPTKDGGDATESGAELPSGPSPLSPSAAVAAILAEDAQKAAHDARVAVQRAEEAHSHLNAQRDVVLKVLATPLNARAADALAAANKGQVIRTPVAPAAALAALSGWLGAAGKTILASLSTWREPRASRSSGRNPK